MASRPKSLLALGMSGFFVVVGRDLRRPFNNISLEDRRLAAWSRIDLEGVRRGCMSQPAVQTGNDVAFDCDVFSGRCSSLSGRCGV